MAIPDISHVMLLFAGYMLGLVAIRLWHSPDWQKNREAAKARKDKDAPVSEVRPRAKSPRSAVPDSAEKHPGVLDRGEGSAAGQVARRLMHFEHRRTRRALADADVVVEGNVITAQGQAYVEFALELVRQMGLYTSQEEYDQDLRWFKNIR